MAKQTFTVGQVLTAAQLTNLQQTAMLGGSAQAKSASYTLVSADAGSAISMTSTSATTVTVNTGLFAAGDTVFIQNLGSGNLTITAGSATVATAGSLILPQNDAGILYFVSTSSSVFYDFIQVGAASPLTTKGDLYGFSTSDARIPIGTNNQVLTADSVESLGLKWATPAGSSPASASSYISSKESTSSTSYTALTTAQAVTLTTGTKVMVIMTASVYTNSATNRFGRFSYVISGATTKASADAQSGIYYNRSIADDNGHPNSVTAVYFETVTAGSNTFTMQFKVNGDTSDFQFRQLLVIDLGS